MENFTPSIVAHHPVFENLSPDPSSKETKVPPQIEITDANNKHTIKGLQRESTYSAIAKVGFSADIFAPGVDSTTHVFVTNLQTAKYRQNGFVGLSFSPFLNERDFRCFPGDFKLEGVSLSLSNNNYYFSHGQAEHEHYFNKYQYGSKSTERSHQVVTIVTISKPMPDSWGEIEKDAPPKREIQWICDGLVGPVLDITKKAESAFESLTRHGIDPTHIRELFPTVSLESGGDFATMVEFTERNLNIENRGVQRIQQLMKEYKKVDAQRLSFQQHAIEEEKKKILPRLGEFFKKYAPYNLKPDRMNMIAEKLSYEKVVNADGGKACETYFEQLSVMYE